MPQTYLPSATGACRKFARFLLLIALVALPGWAGATAWTTTGPGTVNTLSNWTNGTTSPTSFTTPGDTWTINHNMTLPSGATWVVGTGIGTPSMLTIGTAGVLTQSGTVTTGIITVFGDMNLNGGTCLFTATSGAQNINIHGNFTINGGRFVQTGNGTDRRVVIDGNLTMNSGVISSSGTTPLFKLEILGNATINGDTVATKYLTMRVHGNYTINNGYISKSDNDTTIVDGNFVMNDGMIAATGYMVMEVMNNATITCDTISNRRAKVTVHGNYVLNGTYLKKYNNFDTTTIFGNCDISNSTISITGNSPSIVYNVQSNATITSSEIVGTGNGPSFKVAASGNVLSTASTYSISGTVPKISVKSNHFDMNGGLFFISATSGIIDLDVFGNFSMNNATMGVSGTSCGVRGKIMGNSIITGTSAMTNTSSSFNTIHFASASGTMLIANTSSGLWSKTLFYVDTGCSAQLINNFSMATGGSPNCGLRVDGTLTCPAGYAVGGTGIFQLNGSGTLKIASTGGINGNITTTGTINLVPAANYIFDGSSAQVTGTLLPANLTAPGSLVINNSAGVTLSQTTATTGTLSLASGVLYTGSNIIATPGTATAVTGAGAGNFVNGTLRKTVSGLSSALYEVGSGSYTPMSLTFDAPATTGSIAVKCTSGMHPAIATSGILTTNAVDRYWTITSYSVAGLATITPIATYNAANILGGSNASFATQKYTAGAWLPAALATTNTTAPYTSASSAVALTDLNGDYVYGNDCGAPITGSTSICTVGSTTALSNAIASGTWSSGNPAVATVSATGVVTGIATGTAVILYTTPLCSVGAVVYVGVPAITGTGSICPATTTTLSNSQPGGVWSSSTPAVATISAAGVVTGMAPGTTIISYTVGTCSPATMVVTVTGATTIAGPTSIFTGASATLTASIGGGTWASSNPIVATVSSTGIMAGYAPGTATITYALGACIATHTVTVDYSYTIVADSIYKPTDTLCNTPRFYVKVSGVSPLLRLKTYYGDGSKDTILFTSVGSFAHAYATHAYACAGNYTVKQVVYLAGTPKDSITFNYHHSGCNNMRIRLFVDNNLNCTRDGSELLNSASMLVRIDSNGIAIDTLSLTTGLNYKTFGGVGTVYGFSVLPSAGLYATCASTVYDTIRAGVGSYPAKTIALACTGSSSFDHEVFTAIPITAANTMRGNIYVRNNYCMPTDATVVFTYTPLYTTLMSATPTATSTPGTLTWDLTGLSMSTGIRSLNFNVRALPGALLTVGSTITETTTVNPIIWDNDTSNNVVIDVDTVTGPYDPNNVEVKPAGCFTNADTLFQYTINFENMGNDTAHNVAIMDTLSDNVDISSLRVLIASADMDVQVYQEGIYNIARFDFPNINLPDTSHHGLSSGAVIFSIKPKPGLPDGTAIWNRAGIYFDYADVVITNTAITTKGCPTVHTAITAANDAVRIHPNPTNGELTIEAATTIYYIEITNMVGQTVYSTQPQKPTAHVRVDDLTPGMYMIRVNDTMIRKFVKK